MKTIFDIFKRYLPAAKREFMVTVFYILCITALEAGLTLLMRWVIDETAVRSEVSFLVLCLLGFLALLVVDSLFSIARYKAQDLYAGAFLGAMRRELFASVSKMDYEKILQMGKDRLKNILYMDALNVFRTVCHQTGTLLLNLVLIISFLLVSVWVDFRLALILLAVAVGGFAISYFSRKQIIRLSAGVNEKMKRDNAVINEYVDSIELVKTHSILDYFQKKQQDSLQDFIRTSVKADAPIEGVNRISTNYHQLVYLAIAAILGMSRVESAGNMVFFLFATEKIIGFSQEIEAILYAMMRTAPSFENVSGLLENEHVEGNEEISTVEKIEFRNVSFSYSSQSEPVIKNENQTFNLGDVVYLHGANGSGKSTFVKLLTGLLKPVEGEIYLNGVPMRNIKRECVNKNILYISQDEILLNDSLKTYLEEISGKHLSDDEFTELLGKVKLQDAADEIRHEGMSLSGGQRKKLLLAKLMLSWEETPIIILDELENALDADTREIVDAVEKQIYEKRDEHIIFIISHTDDMQGVANRRIEF